MTDEPREETRTDEEQDVEGHAALREPALEPALTHDDSEDEDVEGHMHLRGKTLGA
jgi:hypothetical protein